MKKKVNIAGFAGQVVGAVVGIGLAVKGTEVINNTLSNNNAEPDKKMSAYVAGGVKSAAGFGSAYVIQQKKNPKSFMANMLQGVGVGMGVSGTIDIVSEAIPEIKGSFGLSGLNPAPKFRRNNAALMEAYRKMYEQQAANNQRYKTMNTRYGTRRRVA